MSNEQQTTELTNLYKARFLLFRDGFIDSAPLDELESMTDRELDENLSLTFSLMLSGMVLDDLYPERIPMSERLTIVK